MLSYRWSAPHDAGSALKPTFIFQLKQNMYTMLVQFWRRWDDVV